MAEFSIYYSPQILLFTLSASLVAIALSYLSRFSSLRWLPKSFFKAKEEGKKAVRALPGSWYLSEEMYELERRAIFSKKWLLTTHKIRLPNPGDWLRYQVAGFDFVIAKDRTGVINAFHNVCRHRAFPVVTSDGGNNSILACKYHNWSYALNGKLTKAPSYQEIEGFDKSQNSLFPIHVHIDTNGFIWVNMEAAEKPTTAWVEDYKDIDKQDRFKAYNFDDYQFDHTWQMEGEYNWKLLGDNYNECYHCPTTHPDIPTVADLSAYGVVTENSYVQHLGRPTPEQIAKGFNVAATFYFPNASMNVSPHFFFIQRFIPKNPNTSIMYYEVYRNKNSSDEDFQVINDIYKRIMSEDKYLCANAHKNIQAGVFVNGELHPRMEQGPLFFQKLVRDLVTAHHKDEKKAGQEIWPARQRLPGDAKISEQDLDFCSSVDCAKHPPEDAIEDSETSNSPTPAPERQKYPEGNISTVLSDSENSDTHPGPADIAAGIHLYFKYCHRQPIWCFEREDINNYSSLPHELICSILCLTARFSNKRDRLQLYGHNVRPLIMLRIANGTADVNTDGNINLGQFHVGLALQLCRSAMLDLESAYTAEDPATERKKRLFWSLQLLEQFYGRQTGLSSAPTKVGPSSYSSTRGGQRLLSEVNSTKPALPAENQGSSESSEPGIWNTGLHLGWVWSCVRKFVSDCAHNILKEPWRHDSTYAMVQSDFMETENRIPMCHRYDSVKFYARTVEEIRRNHDYWAPWLKEQFTYHAIPTVLNHPFLYIVGAQHNPNLAIPNTFWKRSSELALLHATWIVRMIDMIVDKQVQLVDPFLGHIAAIAATVHLYYCCAAAAGLKQKSRTDFAKCRRFLKSFLPFSPACAALDRNLDTMTRIAGGYQNMDMDEWIPSKLYLSVPLMWDILQFNCVTDSEEIPTVDLLHPSIAPSIPREEVGENSTLEIDVATSPEIKVDTANGGQDAPSLSRRAHVKPNQSEAPRQTIWNEPSLEPSDNLTFNTTPWLYADTSQFVSLGDLGWLDSQSVDTSTEAPWWEGGTLSNAQLSQF
ncbi:hypothetical protein GQX73_g9098 [Xylaria multiplex]|uniref:Choline monooxygenase, chloroplastic n=1 Tax=Xylaria multiplex TaxID=323545 RepID=A0A7C8MSH1_9PEZI|nr:hypothetical protein GQX73_g9098 [Xylaria multiplex]